MKKTWLILRTVAVTIAPLATVVACKDETTSYDNYVEILVPWDGNRFEAVEASINTYNELKSGDSDYVPIKLKQVGNYGDIATALESKLAAERDDVANLAFAYPDTLGMLSYYDRALDLNVSIDDEYGVDRSKFEEFAYANDQIEGLPTGGYYATSFGRSVDLMFMNKPAIQVITGYMEALGNVTFTGSTWTKVRDSTNTDAGELTYIKGLHPSVTTAPVTSVTSFDDSAFTDMEKFLEFLTESKKYITSEGPLAGIDSMTNSLYQYTFSKGSADYDNFIFNKETTNNGIQYHLSDTTSAGYKNLNATYTAFGKAISDGVLTTNYNGSSWASNDLNAHQLLFGQGSTSSYSYFYDNGNEKPDESIQKDEIHIEVAPTTFGSSASGHTSSKASLLQGAGLVGIKTTAARDTGTRKFIEWFYNVDSKVTLDKEGNKISFAEQKSPAEFVADAADYVYTGNFIIDPGGTIPAAPATFNEAQIVTYNTLAGVMTNDTYSGFENPVGRQTDTLRNGIESTFSSAVRKIYDDGETTFTSFEDFLSPLRTTHSFAF